MRRKTFALRQALLLTAALAAPIALAGCAFFFPGPAPEPVLSHERSDERIRIELEAAIASAMPEVSYQSYDPAIIDPLGKADPSLILRNVETLDGEGRIVCRKRGETVFGTCVFPSPVRP